MDKLILSLDIGSSSCKAVLFNEQGRELAAGKGSYSLYYSEHNTFVEQDPEEIWSGVCEAVWQLHRSQLNLKSLSALSLSSQISSHFFIDTNHKPLTRIMTWMDTRARVEADEMKALLPREALAEALGAQLPAGPSWPIPKLKWLSKHRPGLLKQTRYIVQPKDWILWKLTSEWKSDLSSSRGLAHQTSGSACTELLAWAGAGDEVIPPLGLPYTIGGLLTAHAAQVLQLPGQIPVMIGWNDLNAAVLGAVGLQSGNRGFDITGTSEHIGIITRKEAGQPAPLINTGINSIPFLNADQMIYGVTSSGGQALKWYVENIDQVEHQEHDYSKVMEHASKVPEGADGVVFLPYINGERSPWWNPSARGVFFGLHALHHRHTMSRAVFEGVGYALRTIYERLGVVPETICVAGGASRVQLWNQIKANILGVPLVEVEASEAGCLGAAILAAYGLGWYHSLEEACTAMIRTGRSYEPCQTSQSLYDEGYALFLNLYQALEPLYEQALPKRYRT